MFKIRRFYDRGGLKKSWLKIFNSVQLRICARIVIILFI